MRPGRGDANTARPVGADRGSNQAGSHGGRAASRGPARSVPTRPRIAGVPESGSAGERPLAQFARVGLADDHRAGCLQPAHHLGVLGGGPNVSGRAEGGWYSSDIDVVLDRDRDTEQRRQVVAGGAPPVGLGGVGQRRLGEHHPEGVQRRLAEADGVQRAADQLIGGHLTAGQLVELVGQRREAMIGGVIHRYRHYRRVREVPSQRGDKLVSMRLYRDRAVVLRQHKLGEADRIVTLLTHDHGLVRAVAKGVRRTRSKFGARLEPFAHIDVQLHPGRNLDIVTQVVSLDAFATDIVSDYGRYTSACAMLETAERLAGEERAPAPELHRLTVGALRAVADGSRPRELVLDAYLLRAMSITGWAPALTECARCATPGPHRAFHVAAGGSVCNYCRPAGATTPPLGVLDLMSALRDGDWEAAETTPQSARSHVSGLVAAHLQWHLERQVRTWPLVERIRPGDPMDRMDRSLLDRRIALVRQDVAHGDEPGEPLRAEG